LDDFISKDKEQKLLNKIAELDNKVEALRVSRRVLMSLLESVEKEHQAKLTNCEQELAREKRKNKKLILQNASIYLRVLDKNK